MMPPAQFVLDGGLSNALERYGCDLNHPLWTARLLADQPEFIVQAHLDYLRAGAQCLTTASYQASIPGLVEAGHNLQEAKALLLKSVELAGKAIKLAQKEGILDGQPLIAASIGPYGAYLADGSEYRGNYDIGMDDLEVFHRERLQLLADSPAHLLACETIPSFQEAQVLAKLLPQVDKPAWISFSCKKEQHINDGTTIEDCVLLFEKHPGVFAVGVNCTHPKYVSGIIRRIKALGLSKRIIVYPNSGEVYHAETKTWEGTADPEAFAKIARIWAQLGADIVGGCCRIGPQHIQRIRHVFADDEHEQQS